MFMKAEILNFSRMSFMKVLNKHAPMETKYLQAHHSPFVTKKLNKVIMLRSKLQKQYLKSKSEEAIRACF